MMKYTQQIQDLQSKWFLMVVALLPFPQDFVKWAILIWFGLWILEGRWLHRPKPIRENRMLIPILCFGLWYGVKIVSGLWAEDAQDWKAFVESHATFAALIPIGIWGTHERYNIHQILNALVLGCVAAALIYPFTLYWVYNHDCFVWPAGSIPQRPLDMMWYSDAISIIKHRLFLCTIELSALVATIVQHREWKKRFGHLIGWICTIGATSCVLTTIWTTQSRQSIITLLVLVIAMLCIRLNRKQLMRYGLAAIAATLLAGALLYSIHPRKNEFHTSEITEFRQTDMQHDIRLNIWGFSVATPKDYLAYGIGAGQSKNYLRQKYTEAGWEWYLEQGFNACHNQYLTELVESGIGGLVLFLVCWISLLYVCHGTRLRWASVPLAVIYGMNMLTDDMMNRYDSIALWSVWIIAMLVLQSAHTPAASTPESDKEVSR